MHLSPNICTVLVCLQLWVIHGQADKTVRNALSRLKRNSPEATRRDGRDLSVKSGWFPGKVDLTALLNDINTRFQTLSQSQAQMKTQISGLEASTEELESAMEKAISDQSTFDVKLTQDINEKNEKIEALEQSLRDIKFAGVFTFVSTKATNAAAEEECVKQGGHLASLDTDEKLEYVTERVIPEEVWQDSKVWLGAECVGCSVVNEDKWQWKSGSKLGLDHPLWAKNYGSYKKDLPYDAIGNDAVFLSMRCNGECEFINHAAWTKHPYLCEKSS